MVSDIKTTGSLNIIYCGYFESFFVFTLQYFVSLVIVIAESLRQICEIYFFISVRRLQFDQGPVHMELGDPR